MAEAVSSPSPVIIFTDTPDWQSKRTASFTPALGGSMMPTSPRKVRLPSSGPEARASTEERPRGTEGPRGAKGTTKSPVSPAPLRPRSASPVRGSPTLGRPTRGSSCALLAPRQKQRQPDPQKVTFVRWGHPAQPRPRAPVREAGRRAVSGGAAAHPSSSSGLCSRCRPFSGSGCRGKTCAGGHCG